MMISRFCLSLSNVLVLFASFNLSFGQVVMFPSELKSNLGYFPIAVSVQATGAIGLTCDVTTVASRAAGLTMQGAALTCARGSSNTDWTVTFDQTLARQQIVVSSVNSPITRIAQVLFVACCHGGAGGSTVVSVDVEPNLDFNLTGMPLADMIFQNPAYQNLAPCSCDLTENTCDINCCCDTDCTADQIAVSSCFLGPFGGNFTVDLVEFCSSQEFLLPDWHLFLCIQFLKTPDLGLFYGIDTSLVNTNFEFEVRLSEASLPLYSFATFTPSQNFVIDTSYVNGDPVQLREGTTNNPLYLTLSQRGFSGQCVSDAIVEFQKDTDAECDVTVTQALCGANTILDINSYLVATSTVIGGSGADVNPTVTYMCGTGADYVKTTPQLPGATPPSLFPPPGIVPPVTSPCTPTTPTIVGGTDCQNAVVSVTYTLTWNGGNLTAVQADIVAATVSLSDVTGAVPNNILSQAFRVRFQHSSAGTGTPTVLSGNPGYEVGYPLISGSLAASAIDPTNTLRIWQPGSSGLCAESDIIAPSFGRDVTSGCQLRLALSNFADCNVLRQTVEDQQRLLVGTAGYVSRYGNPSNTDIANDWLQINLETLVVPNSSQIIPVPGQCANILAHTHVHFLVAISGRILNAPIMEIVGVSVSWQNEAWQMRCAGTSTCDAASTDTENFFVTSSVTFTTIPPAGEPAVVLADVVDNRTCERDATCWSELWAPLNQVFYFTMPLSSARMEVEYNLVWALFVIFSAIGELTFFAALPLTRNRK